MPTDRSHAMNHIVVVLFENRSLDNVLGHLYGPKDGKTSEGVIGKHLSNPIPEWGKTSSTHRPPLWPGPDEDPPSAATDP
jgi:phospholipase C